MQSQCQTPFVPENVVGITPSYAGRTDEGRERSSNDDRWGAQPTQCLYIVADGVATANNGGLAAEMVVDLLPKYVPHDLALGDLTAPEAAARFRQAVGQLSDDLHAQGRNDPRIAASGTTVVAAVVTASQALIAHLGDSRAYLYRDGQVHRLTRDHSIVQALVDAGEVTAEEARRHPSRSVLTRHVLMTPPAQPDVKALNLQSGDRILLCSDGLHGVVDDVNLAAILTAHPQPADAVDALIAAANDAGGPDNITVLVVDPCVGPPPRHAAPDF